VNHNHRPYPRLALDGSDPRANAQLFRHVLKGKLNALNLDAGGLLMEHRRGRLALREDACHVLEQVQDLIGECVALIEQVRELPPQPQRGPPA